MPKKEEFSSIKSKMDSIFTKFKNTRAFTLIELLIVIGIIAILAAAVIIVITPGERLAEARNATRERQAHALQNALYPYQIDSGSFPAEIETLLKEICNTGSQNTSHSIDCTNKADLSILVEEGYMASVPEDPLRSSADTGTGYWVAKNDTGSKLGLVQGLKEVSCEEGYVGVPGNTMYGTQDFCVMKYEAKCEESATGACGDPGTYLPVSQVAHTPWISISQVNSNARCAAIGARLISNNEWMTIARNIEAQNSNWTNSVVGSGSIFRGRSNSTEAADASDPLTGVNTRTHTLSNGEVIWDIAGNVWNWTDNVVDATKRPAGSGAAWAQWTAVTDYGDLNYNITRSGNSTWTGTQGIGQYYEGVSGTGDRAFLRGGGWSHGAGAGAFTLSLDRLPAGTSTHLGFRCSR